MVPLSVRHRLSLPRRAIHRPKSRARTSFTRLAAVTFLALGQTSHTGCDHKIASAPRTPLLAPHNDARTKPEVGTDRANPMSLEQVQAALARGKYESAWAGLLAGWPDQPSFAAWYLRARIHVLRGDFDEAIEDLLRSLGTASPLEKCKARVALARLQRALERPRQAQQEALSCLSDLPDHAPALGEWIASALPLGQRNTPEITAAIDRLYDRFDADQISTPEDLLALAVAAEAGGKTGNFHDANQVLSQAQALAPVDEGTEIGDAIALNLARLFADKYNTQDAREIIGEVLSRDPRQAQALSLLAEIEWSDFHLAAAENAARAAIARAPQDPNAHATLAQIMLIEGDATQAQKVASTTLARFPNHRRSAAVQAAIALMGRSDPAYQKARGLALSAFPGDSAFFTATAELLVNLHLYKEAGFVLEDAATIYGGDPDVQSGLGLNRLRLGAETTGREAIDRAWAIDRFNERTFNTRALYAETIVPHYLEINKNGLTLRLPRDHAQRIAPLVENWLAQATTALSERYAIPLAARRIEIYANPADFSVRTTGVPDLGALGVCFGPVVTIVGPYDGTHNFFAVLWHELAHVYALQLSDGRVPRWFTEGLSEWESEVANPAWARESAPMLQEALRRGEIPQLKSLELAFLRADSPQAMERAYFTAALALRYLGETYGHERIVAFLRGFAQNQSFSQLTEPLLHVSSDELQRRFENWLARELDREITGWLPLQLKSDPLEKSWLQLEQDFAKAGDRTRLLNQIEAFRRRGGDGSPLRKLQASVWLESHELSNAQGALLAALKFEPHSVEAMAKLARIANLQDQIDKERDWLRRVLAIDAMSFDPAARLYVIARLIGDSHDQEIASQRMLAIAPLHPLSFLASLDALETSTADLRSRLNEVSAILGAQRQAMPEQDAIAALVFKKFGRIKEAEIYARRALAQPGIESTALRKAFQRHF
jgi:tetratricopeptide (TPR) repeat protein